MRFAELKPASVDPVWETMGPTGPVGPKGEDGNDGRDGQNGNDGQGLNPRGRWNTAAQYTPGDVVSHNSESYLARETHSGKRPTRLSNFWQLLAARGERGERGPSGYGQRGRKGEPGETVVLGSGNSLLEAEFAVAINPGEAIYIMPDGRAGLAHADAEQTAGLAGFAVGDGQYITEGQITLTGLLPGEEYYLSNVAGEITNNPTTKPGEFVVPVGRALSATVLDIEIGPAVLLSGNVSSGGGSTAIFDSDASLGDVVFVSDSGHVDLAQANSAASTDAIGFTLGDVVTGKSGGYATDGTIELSNLVAGDAYYLDPVTPGTITNVAPTAPGLFVVRLGLALTDSILAIEIEPPILLSGNTAVGNGLTTTTFSVTQAQEASQEIALPEPVVVDSIFHNGLRLEEGEDFTVIGSVVSFACLSAGDFVVIRHA